MFDDDDERPMPADVEASLNIDDKLDEEPWEPEAYEGAYHPAYEPIEDYLL